VTLQPWGQGTYNTGNNSWTAGGGMGITWNISANVSLSLVATGTITSSGQASHRAAGQLTYTFP
jgi:hypothetical protein